MMLLFKICFTHWHCVLNTSPYLQKTFYIAIHGAVLAAGAGNKRLPLLCVLSTRSSQQHRYLRCRVRQDKPGKPSAHAHWPFRLWQDLESSTNSPLTFLWQTPGPEELERFTSYRLIAGSESSLVLSLLVMPALG